MPITEAFKSEPKSLLLQEFLLWVAGKTGQLYGGVLESKALVISYFIYLFIY